jgi:tRNA threonylcarbamoyl adenosine modification protein YeaZ
VTYLAIDTVSDRLSLALGTSALDAAATVVEGARRHAAALLPAVDALLAQRGAGRADIRGILVADGPGSFTGLRVAAAVAKAMVATGAAELRAAPSLMARAARAARPGQVVAAVSDALRGEVFGGAWLVLDHRIESLVPLAARMPDVLRGLVPHPDLVVGELPPARRVPFEGWAADMRLDQVADAGALLALLAFPGALERVDVPFAWEPQYGRPAEAQARWEAEHRRPLPHSPGSHG